MPAWATTMLAQDDGIGGMVAQIVTVAIVLALWALSRLAQRQKQQQAGGPPGRVPPGPGQPAPFPPAAPPAPQAPPPAGWPMPENMSVEDIALAMRRAESERIVRRRESQRQLARQQQAQQRAARIQAARQQAAQAWQQAGPGQLPPMPASTFPPAPAPISRPRPAVTPPRVVRATRLAPAAHQPVRQRHLMPAAVGQGVTEEQSRLQKRLQQEAADRARRLSGEGLSRLTTMKDIEAAGGVALSTVGLIRLDDPDELARAILYSEVLGPPMALRRQRPMWES